MRFLIAVTAMLSISIKNSLIIRRKGNIAVDSDKEQALLYCKTKCGTNQLLMKL